MALAQPAPDRLAVDSVAVRLRDHAAGLAAPPSPAPPAADPDAGDRVAAVRDHVDRHFADPDPVAVGPGRRGRLEP